MSINYKKIGRNIFRTFLFGFAIIGLIFVAVYFAMQFGWLNVRGSISERNSYFNSINKNTSGDNSQTENLKIICEVNVLSKYAPLTSINISRTLIGGGKDELLYKMIETASLRFLNNDAFNKDMNGCSNSIYGTQMLNTPISAYAWADSDEWVLMKEVFTRDQEVINKAAKDAGISPRLILSGVIGEQFRFFSSRRESFKSYFEPLKILASLSNTSFGIAGLKPKTVGIIEDNLKNFKSPFYLGSAMEHIVDYNPGADVESERMNRITNAKDPYYSYLYAGLYMREIIAQWQKSGFDISNRPEILSTLYNLGFYYSVPKENPVTGGTVINVNNTDYTFGDLGYEFYYSGELSDIYPIAVQ
jgi:hypothetical protein